MTLTHTRLAEVLVYDPATGNFLHRHTRRRAIAGEVAGEVDHNGYRRISIDGKRYRGHHLTWLWVHGELPEVPPLQVDHINGNPGDNRIENLRLTTPAQNKQNTRRALSNGSTGFLGVTKQRSKYRAAIKVEGKTFVVGRYETPEQAHEAYLKAKRELHPFGTI